MRFFFITIMCLTIQGCTLTKPATSTQHKEEVKLAAVSLKLDEESRALTTGALDALGHAPTNRPTDLAKRFLQRDQQIEGLPVQRIDVDAILATNKAAIESLEQRLKAQQELISDRAELEAKLRDANEELMQLGRLYEQEKARSLWRRIWAWTMATFGTGGLIALVVFCPAILPVLGGLASMIMARIPSLVNLVGVVGKSAFDAVAKGVGNARSRLKLVHETSPDKTFTAKDMLAMLDSELKEATEVGNANFKRLIESRREKLNV